MAAILRGASGPCNGQECIRKTQMKPEDMLLDIIDELGVAVL